MDRRSFNAVPFILGVLASATPAQAAPEVLTAFDASDDAIVALSTSSEHVQLALSGADPLVQITERLQTAREAGAPIEGASFATPPEE